MRRARQRPNYFVHCEYLPHAKVQPLERLSEVGPSAVASIAPPLGHIRVLTDFESLARVAAHRYMCHNFFACFDKVFALRLHRCVICEIRAQSYERQSLLEKQHWGVSASLATLHVFVLLEGPDDECRPLGAYFPQVS